MHPGTNGFVEAYTIDERLRQLEDLVDRLVTEAYHLGCDAQEISAAVTNGLEDLRSRKEGGKS